MKPFHCFFLAETPYGGFVTYTVHVMRLLRFLGYTPYLWKISTTTSRMPHPFAASEVYHRVTPRRALRLSYGQPRVITAWQPDAMGDLAMLLLQAHVPLVVHDPNDFTSETATQLFAKAPPRLITIRPTNQHSLQAHGHDVTYLPHPYVPLPLLASPPQAPHWSAICLSRLDWDKHIDFILRANFLLPPSAAIRLCGAENRLYTHHRLVPLDPHWKRWHDGPFPKTPEAAITLAHQAHAVVDMSRIAWDGGGTQYTFFEAWQADRPLILHQHWLTGADDDELVPDVNCWTITSPDALAEAVQRASHEGHVLHAGAQATLQAHSAAALAPLYAHYSW